jgi:ABC-2 type transport system ATP-binding protein
MSNNALSVRELNTKMGKFNLSNINLNVEKGTIMGFIGKNGAGKTTLIKSILDVIRPQSGEVLFDGIPMQGNEETVKSKIGVVYDSLIFPASMQAIKIVKMLLPFYIGFDMGTWHNLMRRFELNETMKISDYSKGMQMKFSIAMALCHNPKMLILDEPTAGLDPAARADVLDILLDFMQDESNTVFFSTHITSDLDKIADYITLIENGKIIFTTEKDKLLDQYALVHIEKEVLTDKLKQNLTGFKENTFGFEGLCSDKSLFENVSGIKLARPTVEDIMIYRGGTNDN